MESFNELEISAEILKSITELGFTKPSPIQAATLPLLLNKNTDFIGLAATGTGKTAAFGIPLLDRIDPKLKKVQALVLCPTRELALQVTEQINLLGKHKGVRAIPVYGGSGYADQMHGLKSGAPIVVGTPGRLCDHMDRGTMKLDFLKTIVLDEADEMISMGFKDDLEKILSYTPREKNTEESNIWLFSATMSPGVRKVAEQYLKNPKQVHINKTEMLSTTVDQIYYMTSESNKPEVLCKLIDAAENFYGLVFCQTKSLVADLTQYLIARGYKVDSLHGDKDQNARERTLRGFKEKKTNLLICTDVASRGIDVKDITHVINYSLPRELDLYVHRIGRTARSGKNGFAFSLVTSSHRGLVGRIEQMTKSKMREGKIPTRKEVGAIKLSQRFEQFMSQKDLSKVTNLFDENWKTTLASMKPEEIAARFLVMNYPEIFTDNEKTAAMPGNPSNAGRSGGRDREPRSERRDNFRQNNRGNDYNSRSFSRNDQDAGRPLRREPNREYRNDSYAEQRPASPWKTKTSNQSGFKRRKSEREFSQH